MGNRIMKICGACGRGRPDGAYSEEERGRRQSSRRCEECVAAGNQLVLMKRVDAGDPMAMYHLGSGSRTADSTQGRQGPRMEEASSKTEPQRITTESHGKASAFASAEDGPFRRSSVPPLEEILP